MTIEAAGLRPGRFGSATESDPRRRRGYRHLVVDRRKTAGAEAGRCD
jgi:hypothetical protein